MKPYNRKWDSKKIRQDTRNPFTALIFVQLQTVQTINRIEVIPVYSQDKQRAYFIDSIQKKSNS